MYIYSSVSSTSRRIVCSKKKFFLKKEKNNISFQDFDRTELEDRVEFQNISGFRTLLANLWGSLPSLL